MTGNGYFLCYEKPWRYLSRHMSVLTPVAVEHRFDALLHDWRREIDKRLLRVLQGRSPSLLYGPVKYVLEGGGKRIRPILVLLACEAVNGRVDAAWDAAVAVELLHNFTLVHDDIMDRDDTRRGRLTVHKKWDGATALLAGDGLVALAFQTLLQTTSGRIRQIARVFTDGIVELCEGQALDMAYETRQDVTLEEYLVMIQKKTARLLYVAATVGGLVGEGTQEQVTALGEFAFNLGCAFQIQDDLLDITSDEATLGKTYGSDVKRKKQTYLLVHALTHGDTGARQRLRNLLSAPRIEEEEIQQFKQILEKIGSIYAAQADIERYLTEAQRHLETLPPTQGREDLFSLLSFISNRNA
ncbi:MAG: polyprenyl synthetase family protein [Calditrichaeota bacterium]|nr:MAG: polyprenyl synthetase family protein [Calditrichota bacterium]